MTLPLTLTLQVRSSAGVAAILSQHPLQIHDWGIGDATNPDNWAVDSADDQNPDLEIAEILPSPSTEPGVLLGQQFDVTFSRALVPGAQYTVTVSNLQDDGTDAAKGTPIASAEASFFAIPARVIPTPAALVFGIDIFSSIGTGDWAVGPDGDFANQSGTDAYWKRIFRRLTTNPGAFRFPAYVNYGVGAPGLVKKLARNDQRRRLLNRTQQQLLSEPGTSRVQATLQQQPGGVTRIPLTLTTSAGILSRTYPPLPR